MKKLAYVSLFALLFAVACAQEEPPAEPAPEPAAPEPAPVAEPEPAPIASAVLLNPAGERVGTAIFEQTEGGVTLRAEVMGVERDGPHGFHVHENGACAPDFKAAGGHFNPKGTDHACPPEPVRHAGDFGNIEIVEGKGMLEITSDLVTVDAGEISVVGRAVILHEGTDDCVAQPTGAAGARLACGVIGLGEPASEGDAGEGEAGGEDDAS